jgi:hypothetical protein
MRHETENDLKQGWPFSGPAREVKPDLTVSQAPLLHEGAGAIARQSGQIPSLALVASCPALSEPVMSRTLFLILVASSLSGCAVVAVADAAVTVVATTVKVGATVVGAAVDVTAAGVKAVAGSSDDAVKSEPVEPAKAP